jgi:hypothetical protein
VWLPRGDPRLWPTIKAVWELSERLCPPRFPPGVYKHRSIEDAQRQRDLWEQKNFEALWKRRGIDPTSLS